jgi:hypothetical protein
MPTVRTNTINEFDVEVRIKDKNILIGDLKKRGIVNILFFACD